MEASFQTFFIVLIVGLCDLSTQQRTAPGVPPQHYQPQQGQHYQQPPQQYQQGQVPMQQQGQIPIQNMHHGQVHPHGQVPMQQGQVPMQQGQVPMQQGQVPTQQVHVPVQQHGQVHGQHAQVPGQVPAAGHHGGGHAHHAPHGQLLDASNVDKERQHIQEHMDLPIDTSQMSEQELQFHYFKMHDADNNNKLDGCELVKSLIHWHDHEGEGESNSLDDNQISNVVDQVLDYDVNRDGMIDYPEFVTAQNLAQKKEEKKKCATCRD